MEVHHHSHLASGETHTRNVGMKLFYTKYFIRSDIPFGPPSGVKRNAALISNDPALLAEFTNRTSAMKEVLFNYLFSLQQAKLKAKSLISFLKQRYHLK